MVKHKVHVDCNERILKSLEQPLKIIKRGTAKKVIKEIKIEYKKYLINQKEVRKEEPRHKKIKQHDKTKYNIAVRIQVLERT